jgi:hypothetical protein
MGAYPLPLWDGKLLRIACPHCEEYHYHLVRGSGFDNVREANCLRKNLPKKLRGQRLYYRIRPQRDRTASAEIVPFRKAAP